MVFWLIFHLIFFKPNKNFPIYLFSFPVQIKSNQTWQKIFYSFPTFSLIQMGPYTSTHPFHSLKYMVQRIKIHVYLYWTRLIVVFFFFFSHGGPAILAGSGVVLLYISAWLALWSLIVYMRKIGKVLLK